MRRLNYTRSGTVIACAAFWAGGFMLLPEFMPFVFWALVGMIGAWLLVSAIRDKLQQNLEDAAQAAMGAAEAQRKARIHAENLNRHAKLAVLRKEIERLKKNRKKSSHLEAEAKALMAEILRGA